MEILDGFDGFDAIVGAAGSLVPVGAGAVTPFAVAEAIDFFIKNPAAKKWRWAIGFGFGLLVGAAVYKWRGPEEGLVAMGTSLAVAGICWGSERLAAYKAAHSSSGLGRYDVAPAQPLFAGRYVVENAQPLFAQVPQEVVNLGQQAALMV